MRELHECELCVDCERCNARKGTRCTGVLPHLERKREHARECKRMIIEEVLRRRGVLRDSPRLLAVAIERALHDANERALEAGRERGRKIRKARG